jgi:hypothetical protein
VKINITGLDKIELAVELYYAALEPDPTSRYVLRPNVKKTITKRFEKSKFLDEVFKRSIKVDFSSDLVDVYEYDRVNGTGKAKETIDKLFAKKSTWSGWEITQATFGFLFLALIFGSCVTRVIKGDSQACLSARNSESTAAAIGSMALETGDYETIRSAKGDLDSAISARSEACN